MTKRNHPRLGLGEELNGQEEQPMESSKEEKLGTFLEQNRAERVGKKAGSGVGKGSITLGLKRPWYRVWFLF